MDGFPPFHPPPPPSSGLRRRATVALSIIYDSGNRRVCFLILTLSKPSFAAARCNKDGWILPAASSHLPFEFLPATTTSFHYSLSMWHRRHGQCSLRSRNCFLIGCVRPRLAHLTRTRRCLVVQRWKAGVSVFLPPRRTAEPLIHYSRFCFFLFLL